MSVITDLSNNPGVDPQVMGQGLPVGSGPANPLPTPSTPNPISHIMTAVPWDAAYGATVYMPNDGDYLLDGWVEIDTAWNGTTPKGDIGTFVNMDTGLYAYAGASPIDMTHADADAAGGGGGVLANKHQMSLAAASAAHGVRVVPVMLTPASSIMFVCSQDGTNVGADPGATQGMAIVHLIVLPSNNTPLPGGNP